MSENLSIIFKDAGTMVPVDSLYYLDQTLPSLNGTIVRLEAQRGKPEVIYNTKLFTNRGEEIWLSGFTCGKLHAGSLALCELITVIGWDKYVPREEIARIVTTNNSFRMEFRGDEEEKKRYYILNGQGM